MIYERVKGIYMMDYDVFRQVIVERINEFMPPIYDGYTPVIEEVNKVNEVKTALMLKPAEDKDCIAAPLVYLEDMYQLFQAEEDIDENLKFIANVFMNHIGRADLKNCSFDFTDRKDKVIMQLIGSDMNRQLLENIPHMDIMNMSIIFRVIMREADNGFDTVIINDSIREQMGLDNAELYRLARENTRNLFPPEISEMLCGYAFVTNSHNIFGASYMLYEDIMKDLGQKLGAEKFYIIPCSIHEFIAVSEDESDVENLIMMLAHGNRHVTRPKEVLSNSIYSYDSSRDCLKKVASYNQSALSN